MRIVCAWCQQEGLDTVLGEREPLDDVTDTHSICVRHSQKLLEQLPSRAFPGIRVLFVVRATEPLLYQHLTGAFAGFPDIAVIRDRRVAERRRMSRQVGTERRSVNRRVRRARFLSLGYLVVRFGPAHETSSRGSRP